MEVGGIHLLPVLPEPSTRGQPQLNSIHPAGRGRRGPVPCGSKTCNFRYPLSIPQGGEVKTSKDEGSVKPGQVSLRWGHDGERSGQNQPPLDSTSSRVLFG